MEETAIPVTPEVEPTTKSKSKRSAKPKSEQPEQVEKPGESTIETHPAPEPDPSTNGAAKPQYEWDRTAAEREQRQKDLVISRTPFPVPDAKTLPFPKFCEYWNALIKLPVAKYARIYVRRWFPVLLPEEIEDERTGLRREAHPNERKYTAEDGPLDEKKLLTEIGVGDYTFRLNDSRKPWDQATIVHGEKLSTMRNWDLYPPVFDKKRLDWDDDANRVYIKWAQSRDKLPQDRDSEKEAMANVTAIDTVLEDARKERERTDRLQAEALARAERDLKEAKDANKAQPVPAKTGAAAELESIGNVITSLAVAIKPAADTSLSDYLKLQTAREQTEREREKSEREAAREDAKAERTRADNLQAQILADLKEAAKPQPQAAAVTQPAPRTDVDVLEEMVKKQNLLKQLTGRGGSAAEEEDKPDKLEKYVALLTAGAPIIGQFIQGIFQTGQMLIQTWGTVSYNNSLAKNGAEPKPPTTMEKQPEPGKPMPPQGPPPTPEQQMQAQQMPLILAAVSQIIGPLQRALNNSKTGDEFAESMIDFTADGRADYDKVRNVAETLIRLGMQVPGQPGVEQFKNAAAYLFQQFPAFWNKVGPLPTFGAFLEEFYDYDRIAAEKQKQEDN
jgi:hypothetical protein